MLYKALKTGVICIVLLGVVGGTYAEGVDNEIAEPVVVYLTWRQDPTTSIVVHWHMMAYNVTNRTVEFSEESKVETEKEWLAVEAWTRPLLGSDRIIHMAEIGGLKSETRYVFRFSDTGKQYTFKTMPETLDKPVRFVVGGDSAPYPLMADMCKEAAKQEPMFAVIGGDIAYGNADPQYIERWYAWFDTWYQNMITPSGRMIPVIVGIGNHEVFERYVTRGATIESAPYFFSLFRFPGLPGYNVLDFGNYLSLLLLDTGHVNEIPGRQTEWLAKKLNMRKNIKHLIPVYHVPAFPSNRDYHGSLHTQIRENWVPLFESHEIRVAFENHDHTFKRTYPIRNEAINPEGIVYLGDGAWSVDLREPKDPESLWYLEKAESRHHVFVVTLSADTTDIFAIDPDGVIFDSVTINMKP